MRFSTHVVAVSLVVVLSVVGCGDDDTSTDAMPDVMHDAAGDAADAASDATDATDDATTDAATDVGSVELPPEVMSQLRTLTSDDLTTAPPDPSNAWADDPRAAALGQKLFFDPRFSGPLLSADHDGGSPTLGVVGETGKVACASCHEPGSAFTDTRSTRGQISLGSDWTSRKSLSLLDLSHRRILMWDGRRDAGYNQVFGTIELASEFNSSRLFVAQQIERLYGEEYEAVFGPMPDLSEFDSLTAEQAGCTTPLEDPLSNPLYACEKPYNDDVTRVVVNFGKAIHAYERLLFCGETRFDEWLDGDDDALTPAEIRGAALFVGKAGCVSCHSGPMLTDERFHNVGVAGATVAFRLEVGEDDGAAEGVLRALDDELNVRGAFSDGDDGRLDEYDDADRARLLGAFRTPSLRCVDQRPSFMHNGKYLGLSSVVAFFSDGGSTSGFAGVSELSPLDLTRDEQSDLVAFLKSLSGPGPSDALRTVPALP